MSNSMGSIVYRGKRAHTLHWGLAFYFLSWAGHFCFAASSSVVILCKFTHRLFSLSHPGQMPNDLWLIEKWPCFM